MGEHGKLSEFQLPAERFAPAGISGDLFIFSSNRETLDDSEKRLRDSRERSFRVFCVFQRDTGFARQISTSLGPKDGTSFFAVPPGFDQMIIHTPSGEYRLLANSNNELSGAEFQCHSSSAQQARREFLSGITPALDHLSYMANTPLIIGYTVCVDEENHLWSIGYTSPYQSVIVNPGMAEIRPEMVPVYALYREAKNTTSPFYRFLCYYKVLEGIYRRLRPQVFAQAKAKNVALQGAKETIPDHPELRLMQADVIGRAVRQYFDNVLTKEFRHLVAHFILDDGSLLNTSDPDAVSQFTNIILVTELCCRVVISQQEQYYQQLDVSSSPG